MTDADERVQAIGAHLERVVQEYWRHIRRSGAELPAEAGISLRELEIMTELQRRGPRRMNNLAAHVGVATSTMTGVIDRMIEQGWVARDRSAADRRVVNVVLTSAGRKLCAPVQEFRQRFWRFLFGGLNDKDQRALLQLMEKAADSRSRLAGPLERERRAASARQVRADGHGVLAGPGPASAGRPSG